VGDGSGRFACAFGVIEKKVQERKVRRRRWTHTHNAMANSTKDKPTPIKGQEKRGEQHVTTVRWTITKEEGSWGYSAKKNNKERPRNPRDKILVVKTVRAHKKKKTEPEGKGGNLRCPLYYRFRGDVCLAPQPTVAFFFRKPVRRGGISRGEDKSLRKTVHTKGGGKDWEEKKIKRPLKGGAGGPGKPR